MRKILLLVLLLSPRLLMAQSDTLTKRDSMPGADWARVAIAGGGLAAGVTALHIYQANAWWSNNRAPFHVIEDDEYQAEFDKVGHSFGGYYSSFFFDEAYRWAGLDSAQATLLGAFSGALWEFYIETEDGFAHDWGFSRGDAKADIAGAALYLLNNRIPFMRNFRYKWFYTPTSKVTGGQGDIPGHRPTIIEDYGGQTYYVRADVYNMLPNTAQPYWPKWLNLAFGVSGYDINAHFADGTPNFGPRQKAYYISLDYDMDKIIPESSIGILNFLRRALGYWHFPAPALRISPNPKFFLTFPVSITFDHGLHIGAEPSLGG